MERDEKKVMKYLMIWTGVILIGMMVIGARSIDLLYMLSYSMSLYLYDRINIRNRIAQLRLRMALFCGFLIFAYFIIQRLNMLIISRGL